jgi:ribose transport system ATP-binding protein
VTRPASPALELRGITKTFGRVNVLDAVDLAVSRGEIHGLLGANGSGKSTLIKVLSGFHTPEQGSLWIDGEAVPFSSSPLERQQHGLRVMHQDIGLVPTMSVRENLFVGRYSTTFGRRLDDRRMRARARHLLAGVGLSGVDPDQPLAAFGQAERSLVGIARTFDDEDGTSPPRLVVLDEPTASLPLAEVGRLFDAIRARVAAGASVLFVSHEMEEVLQITDRVTVLRDGSVAGTGVTADLGADGLVRLIVGNDVDGSRIAAKRGPGRAVVEVVGARSRILDGVSLTVHAGEIVGLTGLVGAGHEELPYVVFGVDGGVEAVRTPNAETASPDPAWARRAGMMLLPADRAEQSGVMRASVRENATLGNLKRMCSWRGVDADAERQAATDVISRMRVQPPSDRHTLAQLSGGNQQKVLLGRVAISGSVAVLLHAPTQGVDVGARRGLMEAIRQLADEGVGVLYVSNDYDELSQICDRVLVIRRGRIVASLTAAEASSHEIFTAAATGRSPASDATPAGSERDRTATGL